MLEIRSAHLEDAERILEIYAHYVRNTAISFEYEPPSIAEFRMRMKQIMDKYPYLVILRNGKIEGYAYAAAFNGRAAYGWCCELTIYLDPSAQKCGMGRKLYAELEEQLRRMGVLNLYACIAYPEQEDEYLTFNSADFHQHLGFARVGEFHKCGYKFQRWYNMLYVEKLIGSHGDRQRPIERFCQQ